jgi:hypothetical protein
MDNSGHVWVLEHREEPSRDLNDLSVETLAEGPFVTIERQQFREMNDQLVDGALAESGCVRHLESDQGARHARRMRPAALGCVSERAGRVGDIPKSGPVRPSAASMLEEAIFDGLPRIRRTPLASVLVRERFPAGYTAAAQARSRASEPPTPTCKRRLFTRPCSAN